ncbi:hypothetical protein M404DRAFT_999525 [Pisolithus tinctorius Marx 270]|uniref:Uncharacterized protein n=1 Tax=Pisolithus tinctorius Marx 270 TaxID=870435 RepID=A0A0C3PDE3_PISTI|nr:hypothetical protein M404DRAFT_999525 [Pisolithus tinctorius Marx 270]
MDAYTNSTLHLCTACHCSYGCYDSFELFTRSDHGGACGVQGRRLESVNSFRSNGTHAIPKPSGRSWTHLEGVCGVRSYEVFQPKALQGGSVTYQCKRSVIIVCVMEWEAVW